jgi:hypothetical protein
VFGEHALITREKRNASVRSKTYCDLLVLSKIDFDEVMVQYPDFFNSLQKIAARKTDGGWERIRETMKMVRTIRIFGGEVKTKFTRCAHILQFLTFIPLLGRQTWSRYS